MAYNVLILGASYGSLLSTKLLMAGHNVTLVCLPEEAELINDKGTIVRIKLRGDADFTVLMSSAFPGNLKAITPAEAKPEDFDLVGFAMQEPQYRVDEIKGLLSKIAKSGKPCLSIMNMPPLPYLKRFKGLDHKELEACYTDASVWSDFDPALVTLCSPDPQAVRPPTEGLNVLQVGLPTNFKAAAFDETSHTDILRQLETDIGNVRLIDRDVPVKLRTFDSIFVPIAKWSMLLTGNYRCITRGDVQPIKAAVHGDVEQSRAIYEWVNELARDLGADLSDQVPFEKYATAAENLLNPSSAARAVYAGAPYIERVDRVVQMIGRQRNMQSPVIDEIVATVDEKLKQNREAA
ncbi:MAG: hypothetical protein ABJK39_04075 [Hyphomicrobiales bacterium]